MIPASAFQASSLARQNEPFWLAPQSLQPHSHGQLSRFSKEQNAQVSDTTKLHSSTTL
jgi:hypothetical protein